MVAEAPTRPQKPRAPAHTYLYAITQLLWQSSFFLGWSYAITNKHMWSRRTIFFSHSNATRSWASNSVIAIHYLRQEKLQSQNMLQVVQDLPEPLETLSKHFKKSINTTQTYPRIQNTYENIISKNWRSNHMLKSFMFISFYSSNQASSSYLNTLDHNQTLNPCSIQQHKPILYPRTTIGVQKHQSQLSVILKNSPIF